ncbi:hypothetical protein Barb7_01324 [Bacteroidales bacterium Barb7]|nr:hypothetical protein Barb7_01324 [Bacteroidales bacterium Barb7]
MKHLLLFAAFCFSLWGTARTVYYVSPDGTTVNTGKSWEKAVTLHTALGYAAAGDLICIAKGHYYVGVDYDPWTVFKDLTIIGGYNQTEAEDGYPLWDASATVLHGHKESDIDGPRKRVMNIIGTKSDTVHVTVENLTMTDGNGAYDDSSVGKGGGLYNYLSETVLRDVIISNNIASDSYPEASGGGIYNDRAVLTITGNSVIQNNIAATGDNSFARGGGIANLGILIISENTRITDNTATKGCGAGAGGGIYNAGPEAKLICSGTITGNKVIDNLSSDSGWGGGIENRDNAFAEILPGSVIKGNIAINSLVGEGFGGGINNAGGASLVISGGLITSNKAIDNRENTNCGRGGGISNIFDGIIRLNAGTIEDNTATNGHGVGYGGGVLSDGDLTSLSWDDQRILIKNNIAVAGSAVPFGDNVYCNNDSGFVCTVFLPASDRITFDKGAGSFAIKRKGGFKFVMTQEDDAVLSSVTVANAVNDSILLSPVRDGENYLCSLPAGVTDFAHATVCVGLSYWVTLPATPPRGFSMAPDPGEYLVPLDDVFTFSLVAKEDKYQNALPPIMANGDQLRPSVEGGVMPYLYPLQITKHTQIHFGEPDKPDEPDEPDEPDYNTVTLSNFPQGISVITHKAGEYLVAPGGTFDFTLSVTDEDLKHIVPTVTKDGVVVGFSDRDGSGIYRYSLEITDDAVVQIALNYHTVTLSAPPRDLYLGMKQPGIYTVTSDDLFTFTLTMSDYPQFKNAQPLVWVNGNILKFSAAEDGTIYRYSLKVTDDAVVQIGLNAHTVTVLAPSKGLTAVGFQPGEFVSFFEDKFTFTLKADESLPNARLQVIAGKDTLYPARSSSGWFMVSLPAGIPDDITVSASLFYAVTVHPSIFIDMDILPGEHHVSLGDGFTFMLKPYEQYQYVIPAIVVNGHAQNISPAGNGEWYTVSLDVTGDADVQVMLESETSSFSPANAVKIYSRDGSLVIESPAGDVPVTVTTLAGRIKARRTVTGTESIALPSGIYIVKAGAEVRKITING